MKKHYFIALAEIPTFAKKVAHELRGGEVLALVGDLGSGKTSFVKHLAKTLKIKDKVTSPTFVLMNVFLGRLPKNQKSVTLFHLDLYRTKNFKEIKALGLAELWQKKDVVTVIEWADKIKQHLPGKAWILNFIDYQKN